MSSAKDLNYNFSNNMNTGYNAGDWFSDTFLGTQNGQFKNNLELMNQANKFSEYMSNTAYQRGTQDMLAAGINPLVAYAGGAKPASSPSSASASVSPNNGGIVGKMFGRIAKTLMDNFDSVSNSQTKFNNAIEVLKAFK